MEISKYIVRTRGSKVGQCNICGVRGTLTEDHSPPKSCVRPSALQVRHLIQRLAESRRSTLGRNTRNVSNLLNSVLKLPHTVSVRGQPQRIMRAVFGHLAAQGVERYRNKIGHVVVNWTATAAFHRSN